MAESEWTHSQIDEEAEDDFFKGVEEFIAATRSNREENKPLIINKFGGKSTGEDGKTCTVDPGFHQTDVVVIEGVTSKRCTFGTGILLQDPGTWGKIDMRPRRFVLTAAHCVCTCGVKKVHVFPKIRIRVPKKPWKDFPQDKKKYPINMRHKKEAYINILIDDPSKQVFIHPKYNGIWTEATDIALIAIPAVMPSDAGARKIFDMWEVTSGSWWWKTENQATSCAIVGFPFKGKSSHYPFVSLTTGDEIVEFLKDGRMVQYFAQTAVGMSGGSIEFDNKIIGLHNAGDEEDGYSNGLLFTQSLKDWMRDIFAKWEDLNLKKRVMKKFVNHTGCVALLFYDGSVACSGDANDGGDPGSKQSQLTNIESIASTDSAFAAVKRDGTVVTWGCSWSGGDPGYVKCQLTNVKSIASTYSAFAALKRDGKVVTWGQAHSGANPGSKEWDLTNIESIASTDSAFAAKKRDGTVVTWGCSESGGKSGSKQSQLTDVESIASTKYAFAAKKRDGTVVAWGDTKNGGDPSYKQSKLVDIILIASAKEAFAAMKRDGTIICWGNKSEFSLATKNCQKLKQSLPQISRSTRI